MSRSALVLLVTCGLTFAMLTGGCVDETPPAPLSRTNPSTTVAEAPKAADASTEIPAPVPTATPTHTPMPVPTSTATPTLAPMATPTHIPTPVTSSTATPRPVPTATPTPIPVLGSRQIPVPFGTSLEIGNEDSVERWEVTVIDSEVDATRLILDESTYNERPGQGNQFYLARLRARYLGADSATFDGRYRLRTLGDSGVVYTTFEDSCGAIPDEISDRELFAGGTVEGNVCWKITSGDANSLVMFLEPPIASLGVARAWFELPYPQETDSAIVAQPAVAPAIAQSSVEDDIAVTMAIRRVGEQFGDFEAATYGSFPRETQMGFYDHLLVHDGVTPFSPFAARKWSISGAGDALTLVIRNDLKVNTPEAFAGLNFGYINARDVAWNMNRQNGVLNPNLGSGVGVQLGATFGEARTVDDYTVKVPLVTGIVWGFPITEFDINDTTVRLDSKTAYETVGVTAIEMIPVGSGPFTIGERYPTAMVKCMRSLPTGLSRPTLMCSVRTNQPPDDESRTGILPQIGAAGATPFLPCTARARVCPNR